MTCISRLFFSGRVLMMRFQGTRKIQKIEEREERSCGQVLHKLCIMSSKAVRKYSTVYTISKGEMGQQNLSYNRTKSARG